MLVPTGIRVPAAARAFETPLVVAFAAIAAAARALEAPFLIAAAAIAAAARVLEALLLVAAAVLIVVAPSSLKAALIVSITPAVSALAARQEATLFVAFQRAIRATVRFIAVIATTLLVAVRGFRVKTSLIAVSGVVMRSRPRVMVRCALVVESSTAVMMRRASSEVSRFACFFGRPFVSVAALMRGPSARARDLLQPILIHPSESALASLLRHFFSPCLRRP